MMSTSPVVHELQVASQDFVHWLEGAWQSVSSADWVLIGFAAAILVRLRTTVGAMTQIGPVEVELLDSDLAPADVHALTAHLREELASNGCLPAPPVPAGAPKGTFVEAVATSPAPHGVFVATLLQLAIGAGPVQYKVDGVLLGEDGKKDCGIRIRLQPSDKSDPLMETFVPCKTHDEAVERAAFAIYAHIAKTASGAFPIWARWARFDGFKAYKNGIRCAHSGLWAKAIPELQLAAQLEPTNALVRLQLANLCEQQATNSTLRAAALRNYLDVAARWPELVQARYRASVLADTLANSLARNDLESTAILGTLKLAAGHSGPASLLRDLADVESEATVQMLRWWYVPVRYLRARNQFEPRAKDRRDFKRALGISRRCVALRSLDPNRKDLRAAWTVLWGKWVVRYWHIFLGGTSVDWQSRYRAACFEALLLRRVCKDPKADLCKQYDRAWGRLKTALAEAGDQLPMAWVLHDPDLDSLRLPLACRADANDEFSVVDTSERACCEIAKKYDPESVSVDQPVALRERFGLPARPWPHAGVRLAALILTLLGLLVLAAYCWDRADVVWLEAVTAAVAVTVTYIVVLQTLRAEREAFMTGGSGPSSERSA